MVTSICCTFAVIPSAIIALIAEPNPKAWILRPDMELLTIIYSVSIDSKKNRKKERKKKKGPILGLKIGKIYTNYFNLQFKMVILLF